MDKTVFDLGWSELLVVLVICLLVVGPRELPGLVRGITRIMRKIRSLAFDFQMGMQEFARESELSEIKSVRSDLLNAGDQEEKPGMLADVESALDDLKRSVGKVDEDDSSASVAPPTIRSTPDIGEAPNANTPEAKAKTPTVKASGVKAPKARTSAAKSPPKMSPKITRATGAIDEEKTAETKKTSSPALPNLAASPKTKKAHKTQATNPSRS